MDLARVTDILESDGTPLIRTDFSDDAAWTAIVERVIRPVDAEGWDDSDPAHDGYAPHVEAIDDPSFHGTSGGALGEAVAESGVAYGYVPLADARSMVEQVAGGELTRDYLDLSVENEEDADLFQSFLAHSFRCEVGEIAAIEANLAIANMDFHEFADHVGPDGVFRGFPPGA